jgi:enoyl-[acyl-carrier-protein] reductase (NADH)
MPQPLEGKTALVLGVAKGWSLAYAIAQAFTREGAKLILTYQGDCQKQTVAYWKFSTVPWIGGSGSRTCPT